MFDPQTSARTFDVNIIRFSLTITELVEYKCKEQSTTT